MLSKFKTQAVCATFGRFRKTDVQLVTGNRNTKVAYMCNSGRQGIRRGQGYGRVFWMSVIQEDRKHS